MSSRANMSITAKYTRRVSHEEERFIEVYRKSSGEEEEAW